MTKPEAIERVKKLLALAQSTTSPAERQNAETTAKRLMAEHGITENDLKIEAKLKAFSAIADFVSKYSKKHPLSTDGVLGSFDIIGEVVNQSSLHISDNHKAVLVDKLAKNFSLISFIVGDKHKELLSVVETTLKQHGLK